MKTWLIIVGIAGLVACQEAANSPYLGPNQPRVVADGNSVTVVNVRSEAEAQPWAAAYCAKLSKVAHFRTMELYRSQRHQPTDSASFECVAS